ncbi:hypothetical protein SDC9_141011 [bioreactor metagenome]|uniref:Uncharacterized protein n=1 Tax=bioreactor metagenome TaxID=1076179 RepID=A0A645DX78_9ZZZZ
MGIDLFNDIGGKLIEPQRPGQLDDQYDGIDPTKVKLLAEIFCVPITADFPPQHRKIAGFEFIRRLRDHKQTAQ